jgi:hypothetical protein
MTLAQRIHDANRVKANRKKYNGQGKSMAETPAICSCWMCGNPRKYFGERTVQERRAIQTEGWDG